MPANQVAYMAALRSRLALASESHAESRSQTRTPSPGWSLSGYQQSFSLLSPAQAEYRAAAAPLSGNSTSDGTSGDSTSDGTGDSSSESRESESSTESQSSSSPEFVGPIVVQPSTGQKRQNPPTDSNEIMARRVMQRTSLSGKNKEAFVAFTKRQVFCQAGGGGDFWPNVDEGLQAIREAFKGTPTENEDIAKVFLDTLHNDLRIYGHPSDPKGYTNTSGTAIQREIEETALAAPILPPSEQDYDDEDGSEDHDNEDEGRTGLH
ncbi:hypothetical protein BC835DRAFT_1417030 [Cytidiella melzeri]|nr:hypothetical protein BC835DRAFT_1417030 [Cytidiella melzeri]